MKCVIMINNTIIYKHWLFSMKKRNNPKFMMIISTNGSKRYFYQNVIHEIKNYAISFFYSVCSTSLTHFIARKGYFSVLSFEK